MLALKIMINSNFSILALQIRISYNFFVPRIRIHNRGRVPLVHTIILIIVMFFFHLRINKVYVLVFLEPDSCILSRIVFESLEKMMELGFEKLHAHKKSMFIT